MAAAPARARHERDGQRRRRIRGIGKSFTSPPGRGGAVARQGGVYHVANRRRNARMMVANSITIASPSSTVTASAASGYFSASAHKRDDQRVLEQAEQPVRDRLGAGVGHHARAGLGDVAARGDGAAQQRNHPLRGRRGLAQARHRHQRAADRPDEGVDAVPQRVDPRHLVGDELDDSRGRWPCRSPSRDRTSRTRPAAPPTRTATPARSGRRSRTG